MSKFLFVFILISAGIILVHAGFEFRNIECISLDETFSTFEYCYIKAVNRSYKYMSLKVNLLQTPINKVKVMWDFRKRLSGYKPFLYNISFDGCKFIKQSKKQRNPVVNYFYNVIETHSNMNHTCPYDHDLIVEKLDISYLDNHFTKLLPMPPGDYGAFTTWFANDVPRAYVNVLATFS